MSNNVAKCSSCGRITPSRHQKCVYCGTTFAGNGAAAHEEPRMLGSDKPRFQRVSDDKIHYLLAGTREPIALDPGKLFVIGRDPRASLVAHELEVSRQHAEIDWTRDDPPRPVLSEVRSTHGTFLNGKQVVRDDPLPLRSGDEIQLGGALNLHYLYVTERDLRLELEQRGKDETRTVRRPGGAVRSAPKDEGGGGDTRVGDLVAAALGEADLAPLEGEGDFARIHGRVLVKRLYAQRKSGVLTVFDGTSVGEMILVEGRCRQAILGLLSGRDALEQVARLDRGRYRFLAGDPDALAAAPPPSEVDENGLALMGDFTSLPGSELVKDFIQQKASGVLSVFSEGTSGHVILADGLCQEAFLGSKTDREALAAIVRMTRGVYRFRPEAPGARSTRRAPASDSGWGGEPYPEPEPRAASGRHAEARPESGHQPTQSPLKAPDSEDGVFRRSSTPVRQPSPARPSRASRRPPPPPPRRRSPPPPPPFR